MKKQIVIALALLASSFSFAQKNELKAAEKAIKSKNYADAKAAINSAESLITSADDKTKAQFYFLKGQALYADGNGSSTDMDVAIESFNKVEKIEDGKGKFSPEILIIKQAMLSKTLIKADDALKVKKYDVSSSNFEKAYRMSTKDTVYLYFAAGTAVNAEDFDSALKYYEELRNLGYDGVEISYLATNKTTGIVESFPSAELRDAALRSTYFLPKTEKSPSKKAEIIKNIALIYVSKGLDDKALQYMKDARNANPQDVGLILAEANLQLKMGNKNEFKNLVEIALDKDPNNAELLFNLGIIAADSGDSENARIYYNKSLSIDPSNADYNNNMAVLILSGEQKLVEQMNSLGNSAADNKRYDELREKRADIYREAIPYLETTLKIRPNDINAAKTLMNIYSAINESAKFKEMKAKIEAIQSGN